MSRNEWQRGTLTLPTAEVARLKKIVRDYADDFHADVKAEVARLHAEVGQGTRSAKVYRQRLRATQEADWRSRDRFSGWGARADEKTAARAAAFSVLDHMVYQAERPAPYTVAIHKPTLADVNAAAPAVTNKTTTFRVPDDQGYSVATITFEGRTVTWDVSENNHAVDTARGTTLANLFFTALGKITWTRGTGGVIVGNDQYNRDTDYAGGGGNYITDDYGPLGEAARAAASGFTLAQWRSMAKRTTRASARF